MRKAMILMKMNARFLFLLPAFALFTGAVAAQSPDSLLAVWENPDRSDSARVQAYKTYIWNDYLFSNPDSAVILAEALHRFAEAQGYPIAEYQSYTLRSIAYSILSDFSESTDYILRALAGNEAVGYLPGISECHIVIGVSYDEQGNYPRALEHYQKALTIDEKIGNKEGVAMSLNNIGNIYNTQGNLSEALEYYERALAIDEELGVKQGIATELINVGRILITQGDTVRGLSYHERASAIYDEIGDLEGKAAVLNNTASVYNVRKGDPRTLENYERALAIYKEIGSVLGQASTLTYIGNHFLKRGDPGRAADRCAEGLALAEEIGVLDAQRAACSCLYGAAKKSGQKGKALDYFEKMIVLRDSIYNEENTKELTRLQMQYAFDKREAAARAEQYKKDVVAQQELKQQKVVRNGFMGGFAVVLLFAGVFFIQRNRIGKEKERSESLLLNILPEETAKELKEKGRADARLIDDVTVLFTDFKGFTAMSEKLSPEALVKDLHLCFSLFDGICEKYGIEKIKTIGDAYMAAGGLPVPNTTHPQDVVNAALEMAEVVEAGKAKKIAEGLPFFEVRVGAHTGPVVAGIVGIKKFQYDIWGDTVNTASRMESSGEAGKVNISQTTYALLQNDPDFRFESRGKIRAKGKGEMKMYFAERR